MKKYFLLLLIFNLSFCFAQIDNSKKSGKFFKTYEDFVNDKAVEGIKIKRVLSQYWTSLEIEQNGQVKKVKDSEFPYNWFYNGQGFLMRVFDGKIYYVVAEGPLCHYVKAEEAWVGATYNTSTNQMNNDLTLLPNPNEVFKEYYSESSDGEIKKYKSLDDYLEKYGLKEQFKEDKLIREAKDSVLDYKNKEWRKRLKYKKLINEKMK